MENALRSLGRAAVLAAAIALAGCTATVSGGVYGPELVTVSPGVSVIADYDEPIFYNGGFYWRYDGGAWYRSSYYRGGWVYATPPPAILRIDRPYAYRHYRPPGWRGYAARPQPYPPAPGWRGAPPRAPYARSQPSAYAGGGWRGGSAPPPITRPLTAPSRPQPHHQQARPAPLPSRGRGWKATPPPR